MRYTLYNNPISKNKSDRMRCVNKNFTYNVCLICLIIKLKPQ